MTRSITALAALSLWMVGSGEAQDPCVVYTALADSIELDRRALLAVDDRISQLRFYNVIRKGALKDRRSDIAGRLAMRSGDGAVLLEACIQRVSAGAASDTTLLRWFQLARLYVDAQQCSRAAPYLERSRQHPQFASTSWSGTPLSRPVQAYTAYCQNSDPGDREPVTQYSGKRAYLFADNLEALVDDRRYSSDELERLSSRIYTMDQAGTADSVFRTLSPSGDVFLEPPFLLVAGPSGFSEEGFRSERFPVRTEVADHITSRLDFYLEEVARYVVRPIVERLRRDYLLDEAATQLTPVFLVGGGLHGGGLEIFNEFCLLVHRRTCGLRVGYFLPYDHSVMVWLSTGGGTLSHELIHALVYDDFPGAPTWLDEGLASLYEEQDPTGRPIDNYRLFFVQAARGRFDKLLPIAEFVRYPREDFNQGERAGLYAAMARYLALFLHERGVLSTVYKELRDTWADTPDERRAALQADIIATALGQPLVSADAEWADWVRDRDAPKWSDDRYAIFDEVMQLDLDWGN